MRAVVLAGGNSRRYGSNKLLALVNGRPMFTHIIEALRQAGCFDILVVTQYTAIADFCRAEGLEFVLSEKCREGASYTVKEALNYICSGSGSSDCVCPAVLFTAADQPFIKADTLARFASAFESSGKGLASFICDGKPSNPAIFTSEYFGELLALEGDRGGRPVINKHLSDCFFMEASAEELKDIDSIGDGYALPL